MLLEIYNTSFFFMALSLYFRAFRAGPFGKNLASFHVYGRPSVAGSRKVLLRSLHNYYMVVPKL
jgi:hypothetical protein